MYPQDRRNSTGDTAYMLDGMRSTRNHLTLEAWSRLQAGLGGSFTARRRGLRRVFTGQLTLFSGDGLEFGRLEPGGLRGARLEAGGLGAEIRRSRDTGNGYNMSGGGAGLLRADVGPGDASPALYGAGEAYDTRVNLLRNSATVRLGGREVVRVEGGFTGLYYRVVLPAGEEPLALPVALFLLYYVPALRNRAYRAG